MARLSEILKLARLEETLEPGETMVYRSAMSSLFWVASGLWTFVVVGLFTDFLYRFPLLEHPDELFWLAGITLLILGAGIAVALGLTMFSFPAWAITEKRIIVLGGLLRRRREEMPLEAIEDAKYEAGKLILDGDGRTVTIPAKRIPAEILTRSLGRWFPTSGHRPWRLGRDLQPGETVLFRAPSRWEYAYPACMLTVLVAWVLGEYVGMPSWTPHSLVIPSLLLTFTALLVRDAYRSNLVVTNRRLLRRLDYDSSRYDELPLSEVEAMPQSPFADRLFVKIRGNEIQLPAKGKDAERIRAAIQAAKGAAP